MNVRSGFQADIRDWQRITKVSDQESDIILSTTKRGEFHIVGETDKMTGRIAIERVTHLHIQPLHGRTIEYIRHMIRKFVRL